MAKEIKRGTVICESGQPMHSLHMIIKGSVRAVYTNSEFILEKGDMIGLCELYHDSCIFSYIAAEDVTLVSFPYKHGSLTDWFNKQPDFAPLAAASCFRQMKNVLELYELSKYDCDSLYHYLMDSYDEYTTLCGRYQVSPRLLPELEEIIPLSLDEDIPEWLENYYENMAVVVSQTIPLSPVPCFDFLNGLMMKTSQDVAEVMSVCRIMYDYKADIGKLLMNENRLDLFDLYTSLYFRIGQNREDSTSIGAAVSRMMIHLEGFGSIDKKLYDNRKKEYIEKLQEMEAQGGDFTEEASSPAQHTAEVKGSLETILKYAECDEATNVSIRRCLEEYRNQIDKNATDDGNRRLRLNITKLFYKIYTAAFQISLHDSNIPTILKMFFLFGYMDEELAGIENASRLYSIAENFPSAPDKHVYTIYEWLRAIYDGKKEPSRNEFDVDYTAHIHELKVTGKIAPAMEARLASDNAQKVMFELENMFPLVNKITFGRISTFCPVFSEHNILKDLEKSLVSADRVINDLNSIRAIDFGAYCRETVYTNPDGGVAKELVNLEVLPDIILMPNIGIRGVMWQEIEGKRRTTPARLMTSVFQLEDLLSTMARLTGEFRWEICRRIQGARWNDVSERSLTSEYFEYIQFYKKNNDLTPEAKDKIKSALQKAKNSYKEMFVRDYIIWILYEGGGSPRLNKVARNILFTYCPFSKEVRSKLMTNPLYKDILERYNTRMAGKLHHMDNLCQKLQNSRLPVPNEIKAQRKFLES